MGFLAKFRGVYPLRLMGQFLVSFVKIISYVKRWRRDARNASNHVRSLDAFCPIIFRGGKVVIDSLTIIRIA